MTDVLSVDAQAPDPAAVKRAADVLRRGGLVAFPTETVYGLGAHALDRDAVRRVFAAKGRPSNDPLIVHVGSVEEVARLVRAVPEVVHTLASRFWPGPLTLVLTRSSLVPDEITAGLDTVAVRVPAHPVARALIEAAALPVAAPSANLFSRPSPTRAEHVLQDLDGRIDMVLDGGPTAIGVESTVLDLSGATPTVLRPGAVTFDMLLDVLPDAVVRAELIADASSDAMPSPGLLARHYSPRAPLTLYEGDPRAVVARIVQDANAAARDGRRVGIVAADEDPLDAAAATIVRLGSEHELTLVAARLYAALRELDAAPVDVILVRAFPATSGLGVAVADRLRRAAAGRIVRAGA